MGILSKIFSLLRGTATEAGQAIVDRNATTILDQEIRDAQTASGQSKQALTKLMADQKIATDKLNEKNAKRNEYEGYVAKLIAQGNQDLARETAGKVATLEGEIAADQAALTNLKNTVDKLHSTIRTADTRIESLQQQINQVKSTESVLKAQASIASSYSGQNTKLRTALDSLDRIKQRQLEQSAQIDAANALEHESGESDLSAKLAAAGMLPGATSADAVMARVQATLSPIPLTAVTQQKDPAAALNAPAAGVRSES